VGNYVLQVERIAAMLNYFLLQLVGKPQRKTLKLKDPEKYEFRPKELLAQVCRGIKCFFVIRGLVVIWLVSMSW